MTNSNTSELEGICGILSLFLDVEDEEQEENNQESEENMLTHLMFVQTKTGEKIEVLSSTELLKQNSGIIQCPAHGKERVFLKSKDGKEVSKDLIMLRDFGIARCPKNRIEHARKLEAERKAASQELVSVGEAFEKALAGVEEQIA